MTMLTAQEILFRSMMTEGWFTSTDGDMDFGRFFGWVHNDPNEVDEIREAFSEVLEDIGREVYDDEIIGSYFVVWFDTGITCIWKHDSKRDARNAFLLAEREYLEYLDSIEA